MKLLLAAITLFVGSFALAADPNVVLESALPLEGALGSDTLTVVSQYVPGYGLQMNAFALGEEGNANLREENLVAVVLGLSGTIRGLEPNDWVSVGLTNSSFMGPRDILLIRVKQNKPDTLEIWNNGVKD